MKAKVNVSNSLLFQATDKDDLNVNAANCTITLNSKYDSPFVVESVILQWENESPVIIEGLSETKQGKALIDAYSAEGAVQCGFCTPGMVMSAVDLLKTKKNPSDQEIREWLEGNICRCTGYQNIVAAVKEASTKM